MLVLKKLKSSDFYEIVTYHIRKFFIKHWPIGSNKVWFRLRTGYKLNLDNPQTFFEKIQWLKFFWHDEEIIVCMDKYPVRGYLENKGYGHLLNRLINVYDNVDEINLDELPDKFVLKTTHGSSWNVICRDKSQLDWKKARARLNRWMKWNLNDLIGSWADQHMQPRIVCEELIETKDGKLPIDYKIFCFKGEPKFLLVITDRNADNAREDFYTIDWEWLPIRELFPNSGKPIQKPKLLPEMLKIARDLSGNWPMVRIDLYEENDRIIFGEFTFYHGAGLSHMRPYEYDRKFGTYIELPKA